MTASAGDTLIPDIGARKAALRSALRTARIALPAPLRRRAAEDAATKLLRMLGGPRRIAVYLSARSELSTVPLINALLHAGVQVYVPMILRDYQMAFVPLTPHTRLLRGALGLPQPASIRGRRPISAFDAIVMPLLGFDAAGRRLGNGGGYYDRALAHTRIRCRPKLIGYAFAIQQVEALPEEAWDVPLDAIVTERGILRF